MRDVARGHKSITRLENKNLFSDDDLQLSRGYIVRFIFTRMDIARHTYARRETYLQEAVCSPSVCSGYPRTVLARETNRRLCLSTRCFFLLRASRGEPLEASYSVLA